MAGWWRAHTVLSPGDRRGPENERWCVAEHERARKGPAGHRRRRESLTVRRALQIMSRRSTPKPARFGLRPSKHEHYYCTITGLFAFLLLSLTRSLSASSSGTSRRGHSHLSLLRLHTCPQPPPPIPPPSPTPTSSIRQRRAPSMRRMAPSVCPLGMRAIRFSLPAYQAHRHYPHSQLRDLSVHLSTLPLHTIQGSVQVVSCSR